MAAIVKNGIYWLRAKEEAMITKVDCQQALPVVHAREEELRLAMLRAQYTMPDHAIAASDLAHQLGVPISTIHLAYGKLGHDLADALNFRPPTPNRANKPEWWRVLSLGRQGHRGFVWAMHPALAQALAEAHLVE